MKIKSNKKELQSYILKLEQSIREIRSSYDNLITRFETFINKEIGQTDLEFSKYKKNIQKRGMGIMGIEPMTKVYFICLENKHKDNALPLSYTPYS